MRKSSFHSIKTPKKTDDPILETLLKKSRFEGEVYSTTVRLPIELHAQFKAITSKKKKKMGQVLTELVKNYVEREMKKDI